MGIGHTNAHIVRQWRSNPLPATELVCISRGPISTYSGMLPGVLAGFYERDAMEIDIARLCDHARCRSIIAEPAEIDCRNRLIRFADQESVSFDLVSIGIGSEPKPPDWLVGADGVISIKPMTDFLDRFASRLKECARTVQGRPVRIAVIGGGAGGSEIAMCLPATLRRLLGPQSWELSLVHSRPTLDAGRVARTNRRVAEILTSRCIRLILSHHVAGRANTSTNVGDFAIDETVIFILATSAKAPGILRHLPIPADRYGFPLTRPTLQAVNFDHVFLVGDSGSIIGSPAPKAGVFAVRQGPVLWNNIRNLLNGQPLMPYRPQSRYLKLLNSGDGRALGEFGELALEGRWCWRLKDRIDRGFMERFRFDA